MIKSPIIILSIKFQSTVKFFNVYVFHDVHFPLSLDDFFDTYGFSKNHYNFLNLDIQGAELLALCGASKILPYIDYIYTEINEAELYEECCLAWELDSYLLSFGFKRAKTHMTKDKWGDAFYIKQ